MRCRLESEGERGTKKKKTRGARAIGWCGSSSCTKARGGKRREKQVGPLLEQGRRGGARVGSYRGLNTAIKAIEFRLC